MPSARNKTGFSFAGTAFIIKYHSILGFIQIGEVKTVMPSVVKLSEDPAENKRFLDSLKEKPKSNRS